MSTGTDLDRYEFATIDGNEAAARVAYGTNEVIAIYPITPASPMGELSDAWAVAQRQNIWGNVPSVIEMQSEGGAAGAVHGALQGGAITCTFTASQGLLLMIPNMFKIAGELTPSVFHVAARTVATHALSIFGDHSDVMAARGTGFGFLASSSVQEAHDFALIAQAVSLTTRIPFVHFFDGFRTSHEVNKIRVLSQEDIRALIDDRGVFAHRARALSPERPVLRGSAQNPDVFFQAREAINPFYQAAPKVVVEIMDHFFQRTGRRYHLFDYVGAPDADRVVVLMGSGVGAAIEAVGDALTRGEKVGVLTVRLYRPFDGAALSNALPKTVRRVAVLDRTKEPGAGGEPLYLDTLNALTELRGKDAPQVVGGRYGLSSKEFTPAMVHSVFENLRAPTPKRHFTVGIVDDVSGSSLDWNRNPHQEPDDVFRAVLYGLGSDGTVGANKNTVKIVGDRTELHTQGYFVYDSKKAGAVTVSHLRFSPRPITSTYLIQRAHFVACHQPQFLDTIEMLSVAENNATFLLNTPDAPDEVFHRLPLEVQRSLIEKKIRFYVVNARRVAEEAGLGGRISTVMQTCFFVLTEILPPAESISAVKEAATLAYRKRGETWVSRNLQAIDAAVEELVEVHVPKEARGNRHRRPPIIGPAPDFVKRVTAMMLDRKGDLLPVSALPVDGTFVTGTSRFEKRNIANTIPIWDPDICTQCGLCPLVCPHAAIRMKAFPQEALDRAPPGFQAKPWSGREFSDFGMTIQVAPEDCTGCGVCVEVCPAKSKEVAKHKAINMEPKASHLSQEIANYAFFLDLPEADRTRLKWASVKGSQLLEPLFEYSGACAGCGETPYLKLLSQLFGDRLVVANATGCSSIYGGNLPTTPWTKNSEGRGPAWANSLFEDNAEFGLGIQLAMDAHRTHARDQLQTLVQAIDPELIDKILRSTQDSEGERMEQRRRVATLKEKLAKLQGEGAKTMVPLTEYLLSRTVWIVGGDGWAYDIGFGGLDHALASGRNVNILVLDTEVYSNTGGQASKATPRAAVAKFEASGKSGPKKDLGMIAMAYGNVYVAQVALGASPLQTVRALVEADSYAGPSLVISYSPCIAHGIDMRKSMARQKEAVKSGYWPLYRFDPRVTSEGRTPFHLDSQKPTLSFKRFAESEARFAMLMRSDPVRAQQLFALAQQDINERFHYYRQLAKLDRHPPSALEKSHES